MRRTVVSRAKMLVVYERLLSHALILSATRELYLADRATGFYEAAAALHGALFDYEPFICLTTTSTMLRQLSLAWFKRQAVAA